MSGVLPDTLVVGPMKAGTSWVHDYLSARGDVCLPRDVKETFFFDRYFSKGLDWYGANFEKQSMGGTSRIIEVGPSYFHCPDAPLRVLEALGQIRIVVVVRDPVRRSWSHYLHLRRKGYTNLPFREAVSSFPEILDASRYTTTLSRWLEAFGEDNVELLLFDDLATIPEAFVERLCSSVRLPYERIPDVLLAKSNESAVAPAFWMAWCGRKFAEGLRSSRLYFVVNFAKRMGLKNVFFGRPGSASLPELSDEDRCWLSDLLSTESARYHAIKRDFLERRRGS